MSLCFIDIETYAEVDLTKVGTPVYARHPATEVLMVAWAVDGGEVQFHDFTDDAGIPTSLQSLFDDEGVTFSAWNAAFEIELFKRVLRIDIPLTRWRCSMVHALSLALPGSLGEAGKALQLPDELLKMTEGRSLIRLFSMPRKPTKAKPYSRATAETDPEDWATFCDYNMRDVETERAIYRRLRHWRMPDEEWAHWRLDRKINDTGLPIDGLLVERAIAAAESNLNALSEEARGLTGLANPNSPSQLQNWLQMKGVELADMTKASVAKALQSETLDDKPRRVLEIRQEMGKTSVKKFDALSRATNEDDRLRHCLQFYGASRTGRWAGRTFQPQNIPRGSVKKVEELRDLVETVRSGGTATMDQLTSCIRSAVRAPDGQLLRVADLANIESRILGWISNSKRMLHTFATDRDIYKDFGTELFQIAYDDLTKEQRNYSKPPTLGCFGYHTPTLTDSGWKSLGQVSKTDKVWDGIEWVPHAGVAYQGEQEVIDLWGVQVTPEHRILCGETWSPALSVATESGTAELAKLSGSFGLVGSGYSVADWFLWRLDASGVVLSVSTTSTTFGQGGARAATAVLKSRAQRPTKSGRKYCLTREPETLGVADTPGCLAAAIKSRLPPSTFTGPGGYGSAQSGMTELRFCAGSQRNRGIGIPTSNSTEQTMKVRIRQRIADWLRASRTPIIGESLAGLYSKVSASLSLYLFGSTPTTSPLATSVGGYLEGILPSKSRKTARQKLKVPTYDVVNAGPRNRFTILTGEGPLIVHNCGYGLGARGLVAYAEGMGQTMTIGQAKEAVDVFRSVYWEVPRLWRKLEDATFQLTEDRRGAIKVGRLRFTYDKPWLFMQLPSGRRLAYLSPRIEQKPAPWDESQLIDCLTYMGTDQYTRKWKRLSTFGGKWVEQACQAISRDLLANGLKEADEVGFEIVGHTHDEIIALSHSQSWLDHDVLSWCMYQQPHWGDDDLYLGAEGFSDYLYRKD